MRPTAWETRWRSADFWSIPARGDRIIAPYAARLAKPGSVTLDVRQCPDLVPALAVQAALRAGEVTEITGAARLRIKESDRLETVSTQLNRLGARITQTPDSLVIHGVPSLHGGLADSCNDHRIAMMLAMAATRADGTVRLMNAAAWPSPTRISGRSMNPSADGYRRYRRT